jgi:imidazolonepropionase-like amidohydrolase
MIRYLLVALLASWLVSTPAHAGRVIALVGGTVIDGYGSTPITDGVVVIEGEHIRAVGPRGAVAVPAGAEIIPTDGMTVLPGLWDLQVHLMQLGHGNENRWNELYVPLADRVVMPIAARQLLMAGVTSVRDTGAPLFAAVNVRERIRLNRIPGPTLYVSGPVLTRTPMPGSEEWQWAVSGPKDARERVRRLAAGGVDYVLIADIDRWSAEELMAVADEARSHGLPLHARAERAAEVERGLALHVDGFVGIGMGAAPAFPDTAVLALRQYRLTSPQAVVHWTPGISAVFNFEALRQDPSPLADPRSFGDMPAIVAQDIRGSLANPARVTSFGNAAARRPTMCTKLGQLHDAGVHLVIGSDAGAPGHLPTRATWQEIAAWVTECGLDPMAAIRAATHEAAVAMGAGAESGSLVAGRYADVIAVRGDVLKDVRRLRDVEIVIRRGQRYR